MTETQRERLAALLTALLFAGVAATLLAVAYTYSKASSLLPRFAGWIFLSLALLEVLIQIKGLVDTRRVEHGVPAPEEGRPAGERMRAVQGFLWLTAMLAALYLTGFLVTTPAFIFTFLWISAGQSAARSAVIAAVATAFVWLGFVELLEYDLFAGVLFQH